MANCIFCNVTTEHSIGKKGKSICLNCLIELKKFEFKHRDSIIKKALPGNLKEIILDAKDTINKMPVEKLNERDKEIIKKAKETMQTIKT